MDGYCEDCLPNTRCDGHGHLVETLVVANNYWRGSARSTHVRRCFHKDACTGGAVVADDGCEEGYRGALCAVRARRPSWVPEETT